MADNDVQLDLKKRARRRLVGAIALALLAAIVLPMVMDPEPRPGNKELQIRIPSQEGSNFASRLITGAAPPQASPALPAQSLPSAPAVTQSVPRPVAVPVADVSSVPPGAEASAPVKPVTVAPRPSAIDSGQALSEAERARQILEGKPAVKQVAGEPSQKFFIQLGVFRDEANARGVVSRAAAVGVKAVSMKDGGMHRVRSGPFKDRTSADAAAAKLIKDGLSVKVVQAK